MSAEIRPSPAIEACVACGHSCWEGPALPASLLLAAQAAGNIQVGLPLVAPEVEHFKRAEGLACRLRFPLHLDQPLAGGVDAELAQVRGNPLAPQLLRHRRRGAGTAEEIGDEIAFVRAGVDNAFEKGFRFNNV